MMTVLSANGWIELPDAARRRLHLKPGQDFDVLIDDDDESITLIPVPRAANQGLVDHLLACPASLEISPRASDDSPAVAL